MYSFGSEAEIDDPVSRPFTGSHKDPTTGLELPDITPFGEKPSIQTTFGHREYCQTTCMLGRAQIYRRKNAELPIGMLTRQTGNTRQGGLIGRVKTSTIYSSIPVRIVKRGIYMLKDRILPPDHLQQLELVNQGKRMVNASPTVNYQGFPRSVHGQNFKSKNAGFTRFFRRK
jgi:hypothetical protein